MSDGVIISDKIDARSSSTESQPAQPSLRATLDHFREEALEKLCDKGTISNLLTLLIMLCGIYLRHHCDGTELNWFGGGPPRCSPPVEDFSRLLLAAGLFGFSGGVTNVLAIHMLFEPVCNLPGTGVVPRNFKEIRQKVKTTIMSTFFDGPHVEQFVRKRLSDLKDSVDLGARLVKVLETSEADAMITQALTELLQKPEGWPLLLFGSAPEEMTAMVKPFLLAMAPQMAPLLGKMLDGGGGESLVPIEKIRAEIDGLMDDRLQELSPERVKQLIEAVMKKQLGWLVVWGNVAGALIGVASVLIAGMV